MPYNNVVFLVTLFVLRNNGVQKISNIWLRFAQNEIKTRIVLSNLLFWQEDQSLVFVKKKKKKNQKPLTNITAWLKYRDKDPLEGI